MFDSWGEYEEIRSAGTVATIERWDRPDALPEGLAGMTPGADLGLALAGIDPTRLAEQDRVTVMQAWARQLAHAQAELYLSMSAVAEAVADAAGGDVELAQDLAASEIRAALAWTRRAADAHLDLAWDLLERHPRVWESLHRGEIDLPKARVIIEQTSHLDEVTARRVAGVALEKAALETTGQLRARIRRLAIAIDPDSARGRYEARLVDRRVVIEASEAGTANLFGLDLPAADANAAMRRINRLARSAKTADDPRTIDQIRADILLDLLNGRQPGQSRGDEAVAHTCVFPGCRMPARDSDLDHRQAWTDGGPTQEDNLEPLCRHDHRLKHAGWKLEGLETGEYQWTSPLGLKYTVDPRAP